ncbi:hypothetical protein AVEN_71326-1 [Araneus ventricosus]|uniref:Uncharacterized protein n=1 Tax=Araneus ventricosus TaxID=182803 RepID=A0A4Y2BIA4_ARAVE|nr:hypothetical protein AVEN_71326-1 [Araneus ventricosus]
MGFLCTINLMTSVKGSHAGRCGNLKCEVLISSSERRFKITRFSPSALVYLQKLEANPTDERKSVQYPHLDVCSRDCTEKAGLQSRFCRE